MLPVRKQGRALACARELGKAKGQLEKFSKIRTKCLAGPSLWQDVRHSMATLFNVNSHGQGFLAEGTWQRIMFVCMQT